MSTVYTLSALLHLSDLQLRGLLNRARYDLNCSVKGSIERRDALLNLEIIRRALAVRLRAAPAAGVLNPAARRHCGNAVPVWLSQKLKE